jgi:hypothetical protein
MKGSTQPSPWHEVQRADSFKLGAHQLAAAAYLGRYTGVSRLHSESDLPLFFTWCVERDLPLLAARRAQIELYVRWMQKVRRSSPPRSRAAWPS